MFNFFVNCFNGFRGYAATAIAAVAIGVGLMIAPDAVFAQSGTVTIDTSLISWSGLGTSILTALGNVLVIVVGIGLSVGVAWAGYKFIRYRAL